MIDIIIKTTNNDYTKGRSGYTYTVHYTGGRVVRYPMKKALPKTAVLFLLKAHCTTTYTESLDGRYIRKTERWTA